MVEIREMEISSPEINYCLESIVSDDMRILAPFFGLNHNNYELPETVLYSYGFFNHSRYMIGLPNRVDIKDFEFIRGHEVGHLLHYFINKKVFNQYSKDQFSANYCEMMADWSSRIVQDKIDPMTKIKEKIKSELDGIELPELGYRGNKIRYYENHKGGILAAEFLYHNYGTENFMNFAGTNPMFAQRLLKDLGYDNNLVIRYIPELNTNK